MNMEFYREVCEGATKLRIIIREKIQKGET